MQDAYIQSKMNALIHLPVVRNGQMNIRKNG